MKADNDEYPVVKFVGQPLAGVAAASLDIAEEAVALIDVEYEHLDFVIDVAVLIVGRDSSLLGFLLPTQQPLRYQKQARS